MIKKVTLLFLIFLLLILCLFSPGCRKANPPTTPEEPNLFPLVINNWWMFSVEKHTVAGTVDSVSEYFEKWLVSHAVEDTNSIEWFVLEKYRLASPESAEVLVDSAYYGRDSLFIYTRASFMGVNLDVIASPKNPKEIPTWSQDTTIMGLLIRINGSYVGDTQITVPSGEFQTFNVMLNVDAIGRDTVNVARVFYWLGDNVGPIMVIYKTSTDSTIMKLYQYQVQD